MLKYLKEISEAKTTMEAIKCTTRRYTFLYLLLFAVLVVVVYWISDVWLTRVFPDFSGLMRLIVIVAGTFVLVLGLYLTNIDNIQREITARLRQLIDTIRHLRPDNPGAKIDMPALRCDDELQEIVSVFNLKSTQIQQYIDYLKKLIGYMHHEFNTPLAVTQLHVDRLKAVGIDHSSLEAVQDELNHMSLLMTSLSGLLSMQTVKAIPEEDIDLVELISAVQSQLETLFPESSIEIIGLHTLKLRTRKEYAFMIFKNLIENALKYGGAQVEVEVRSGSVIVRDHGQGIDPHDIEHIWLPFWK